MPKTLLYLLTCTVLLWYLKERNLILIVSNNSVSVSGENFQILPYPDSQYCKIFTFKKGLIPFHTEIYVKTANNIYAYITIMQ
jgi:hypothetical protein